MGLDGWMDGWISGRDDPIDGKTNWVNYMMCNTRVIAQDPGMLLFGWDTIGHRSVQEGDVPEVPPHCLLCPSSLCD